jgi:DNA (cytosine-5)-methyltransferase 1
VKSGAYYNEHDQHAANWLRNLIRAGLIADGDVDERSIVDVRPDEIRDYRQAHFFAGVGVWSFALRQAGWTDDRPAWTGSCPCQPFSAAGKRGGTSDERHLWPAFFHLIEICRPPVVFGEQVASKDGLAWLDLVHADLEAADYAVGAFDLCAAGVGAPHIRQRLFFVADASSERRDRLDALLRGEKGEWGAADILESPWRGTDGLLADANGRLARDRELQRGRQQRLVAQDGGSLRMADSESFGLRGRQDDGDEVRRQRASGQGCEAGELGDADEPGLEGRGLPGRGCSDECVTRAAGDLVQTGPTNGFWRDADWIGCTDGKWRPVESGSFPLVYGSAFRLGSGGAFENKSRAKMLRGYGNAIVAPLAAEFIAAAMECLP